MAANLTTTYASQILDLLGLSKFKGGGGQCPLPPPPPIKISLMIQHGCCFAGGAEASVYAAADLQDENDAERQPPHYQAAWRAEADTPTILPAGVPLQAPPSPRPRP